MNIVTLDLDKIDDSDRLRPVDPAYGLVMAESIAESGQLTPIEVQPARKDGKHKLNIGAHRVWAMRHLGLKTIEAVIFDGSDNEAALHEIDENLCRHDLNELDRAIFLGKRKEVFDRLHPQAKYENDEENQSGAKLASILRFTLETARDTKQSLRTIQRLVHRYENIIPQVRERLKGTWLASVGSELDALAKVPPDDQAEVVEMLLREVEPQPNVHAARIAQRGITQKPRTTADEQCSKLIALWRKTGADGRKAFRTFLDTPSSRKAGVVGE